MFSAYDAVKKLAIEEDPHWLIIVDACLETAKDTPEFAGAWALEAARKRGVGWFPNLRLLVRYGILKRVGGSVGKVKRRAYYVMPDPQGVDRALQQFRKARI